MYTSIVRTWGVVAVLVVPCVISLAPAIHPRRRHHQQQLQHYLKVNDPSCHRLSSTTRGDINADDDDLTKEELLTRLSEVRTYYRQRPEEGMTQSDVCLKLLSTRLPGLRLNRSFVAQSTIPNAGYGLFASRDINDRELITLYPGDAVFSKRDSDAENNDNTPFCLVMFGSHIKVEDRNTTRVMAHEARGYEMEINQHTSIVGDPLIGFSEAAYLGHFANDGAYLREFDSAGREEYSKETIRRYNAVSF